MRRQPWRFTPLLALIIGWPMLATSQGALDAQRPSPAPVKTDDVGSGGVDFQAAFPTAGITRDNHGNIRMITGLSHPRPANVASAREHAREFLVRWGDALGTSPRQWRYEKTTGYGGRETVLLSQRVGDIPVIGGSMKMTFAANGALLRINGVIHSARQSLLRGPINRAQAHTIASTIATSGAAVVSSREVALPLGNSGALLLAHEVLVEPTGVEVARSKVRIDSRDGRVISRTSMAHSL